MMLSLKAAALAALSLASLLVDAAPALVSSGLTGRGSGGNITIAATGYKNVVYFTNWYVSVLDAS